MHGSRPVLVGLDAFPSAGWEKDGSRAGIGPANSTRQIKRLGQM